MGKKRQYREEVYIYPKERGAYDHLSFKGRGWKGYGKKALPDKKKRA